MYEPSDRQSYAHQHGIRRRLAPMMEQDRRRIELIMDCCCPCGHAGYLLRRRFGIGRQHISRDRNGVRTPMQWNGGWNGGFSAADPERLYSPVIRIRCMDIRSKCGVAATVGAFTAELDEVADSDTQFISGVSRGSIDSRSLESQSAGIRSINSAERKFWW